MSRPHVENGLAYAAAVLDGTVPACKWVRLACERHRIDQGSPPTGYEFDPVRAEDVANFCESFPHTKGKWAKDREPFVLLGWQCFVILSVFGWVHKETGLRRFRRAMLMVPRKNGKSDFAARIALWMFAADGEYGAEVFSGATSEAQAFHVYRPAFLMAKAEREFQDYYNVEVPQSHRSRLTIPKNGSFFSTVIGKPGEGASPSCAVTDEYHEHDTDDQLDTQETGMGAREQPLSLIVSTAGNNMRGPCYQLQLELQKILEGTVKDDSFFGSIWGIDDEDDPFTDASLIKANPSVGAAVSLDFLCKQRDEAVRQSRKQGTYKTRHLNVWVGARTPFFDAVAWQKCKRAAPDELVGNPLFVGVDLASKRDIASVVGVFDLGDEHYATFGRHYIPETATEGEEGAVYAGWVKDEHLIATEGNSIDYTQIENDLLNLHERFGITELGFDPMYAHMLIQRLMAHEIECVEVRPSVMNFSEPMKVLDALIIAGKVAHEHNAAMGWMISNVVAFQDAKDNVYPRKETPEAKIDGPVALIMAMSRALSRPPEEKSIYETRGALTL